MEMEPIRKMQYKQIIMHTSSADDLSQSPMKLINFICDNVEDLVVVSAHGYRSEVFFCDISIATLKTITDRNKDVNQEAALDVVTKKTFKK